jgi:NADH:ubiquinone oxidoreductase subunit E
MASYTSALHWFHHVHNSINFHAHFQLCGTTPCMVCGSEEIKKTIEEHLNMHVRCAVGALSLSPLLCCCANLF